MTTDSTRPRPVAASHRRWYVAGALAGLGVGLLVTAAAVIPAIASGDDSQGGGPPPGAIPPPVSPLALQVEESMNGPLPGVPDEYQELVRGAAATCPGLPAPILAAQIEAESTWDPNAVSEAGAEGMAQFLPTTWDDFGVDGNGNGTADPFEPADAIYTAAAYDCDLLGRLGDVPGDPMTNMLAAYHAGPGEVVKAGGVPPIAATSHYVWHIYTIGLRNAQEAVASMGGQGSG